MKFKKIQTVTVTFASNGCNTRIIKTKKNNENYIHWQYQTSKNNLNGQKNNFLNLKITLNHLKLEKLKNNIFYKTYEF